MEHVSQFPLIHRHQTNLRQVVCRISFQSLRLGLNLKRFKWFLVSGKESEMKLRSRTGLLPLSFNYTLTDVFIANGLKMVWIISTFFEVLYSSHQFEEKAFFSPNISSYTCNCTYSHCAIAIRRYQNVGRVGLSLNTVKINAYVKLIAHMLFFHILLPLSLKSSLKVHFAEN